jgi:hypothetical protein
MTVPDEPSAITASLDERHKRVQDLIDTGREAELSEEEYQFALEKGLIEG